MIVVKKDAFPMLKHPIASQLFGANKTWRGFVFLPVTNGVLMWVWAGDDGWWMGALLGFTYVLFELPNSLVKRRLGIPAGAEAENYALLFKLMDKTDSSLGVALVGSWMFSLGFLEGVLLFIVSVMVHMFFSWLLVIWRVKRRF
jgi:hypothetical protein